MSKLYTVKEVAKKLRVSEGHVYSMVKRGDLKSEVGIGRVIRISGDSLLNASNISNPANLQTIYNPDKIELIETSLGKIRKVINADSYVLVDISRAVGLKNASTISKALGHRGITRLSAIQSKDLGISATTKGNLLICMSGIKEYRNSTILFSEQTKKLIDELQSKEPVEKFVQTEIVESKNDLNAMSNVFESHKVNIIEVDGQVLFELYSTGMALGHVKNAKGKDYPRKERVDAVLERLAMKPVVKDGQQYLNEPMLYDFMLETRSAQCIPFRKWVTGTVLPQINKTGGYVANPVKFADNYFSNFSEATKKIMADELKAKNKALFDERDRLDALIKGNIKVLKEVEKQ